MQKRNAVSRGSRVAIVLSVLLVAPCAAIAVEEHHAGEQAGTPEAMPMQEQMMKMQGHMLKMHEQMHKIMAAKKPADRERLMQEHRQMMQDHMKAMHGPGGMMGGGMMKDCPMMDRGMMGGGMQKPMDGTGKDAPPPVK